MCDGRTYYPLIFPYRYSVILPYHSVQIFGSIIISGGTGTGPSGPRSQGGDSPQGKDPRSEQTDLLVQTVDRPTGRSGNDHQRPEDGSPDEPLPVQENGGGSPERLAIAWNMKKWVEGCRT